MKTFKMCNVFFQAVVTIVLLLVLHETASAQQFPLQRDGLHLVATNEVSAQLSTPEGEERVTGRVSFHLISTPERFEQGEVMIRGFNLAFPGVSQRLLLPEFEGEDPLGLLGIAMTSEKVQSLQYDAGSQQLFGEVAMFADASLLNQFAEPSDNIEDDVFATPIIPVTASIFIELEEPLEQFNDRLQNIRGRFEIKLFGEPIEFDDVRLLEFELGFLEPAPIDVGLAPIPFFEVAQRLCVQPVNIMRIVIRDSPFGFPFISIQTTGDGFPFGKPGAVTEWAKGDVVFEFREPKIIFASSFWELENAENNSLRMQVDDGDCIEVFFVNTFDPPSMWGGGATWGSGTASAKVISSDGNARGGIDLTHLAHELGHVIGLLHPNDPPRPSAQPASSGTLMCPSGFLNDNPMVNSQENKDLVSNALLTFSFKVISAGPDCLNSADCGACP